MNAAPEDSTPMERLAETEARLLEAQRVAHVGSWQWDIASNRVTWSDEMYRIYGLAPREFGQTYEDFLERVHPEDRELTQKTVFGAYRSGQPFTYDHRIVRADGSVRMLHTQGAVVSDPQGRSLRLVGSCWDITDTWVAEHKLERSMSLLRATLESTADGLLVVDLAGQVVAFNQRLLELWGIQRSRVQDASFESLLTEVHPLLENGEACLLRVRELDSKPDAESFDVLSFHDGRVFERYSRPQRVGSEVVGRVWSYRNVTDREALLRRAVFLSEASRLLATLDIEPALESVARLALATVADSCAVDVFAEGGGPRRLLSVSRDHTKPWAGDLPPAVLSGSSAMKTDGGMSWVAVPIGGRSSVLGALTFALQGERRYAQADLTVFEELARRAALSIEKARAYRGAEEALRARDELLGIAAHELRGPVTSLRLSAQALKQQPPPDAREKMLDVIDRETRRVAHFVDELLDVGRVRSGAMHFELEEVDLAEVTRDAAARLAPEITRSRCPLSLIANGPTIGRWDRSRLEQVVTNLLDNALKFGRGKPIEVSVSTAGSMAQLSVRDQGLGIPHDRQSEIFAPFERAVSARHYGGLGLGLYIVRRTVEGLGGTVELESAPGKGSTFTVKLPRASASA
jgi:PAS domain S-box-containing protein